MRRAMVHSPLGKHATTRTNWRKTTVQITFAVPPDRSE